MESYSYTTEDVSPQTIEARKFTFESASGFSQTFDSLRFANDDDSDSETLLSGWSILDDSGVFE